MRCSDAVADDFRTLTPFITSLAGVGRLECGPATAKPKQAATHVHPEFESYVSLAGLIDAAKEAERLQKELAGKLKHLQAARAKLGNSSFVDKAPAEVVQQQRDLIEDMQKQVLRDRGELWRAARGARHRLAATRQGSARKLLPRRVAANLNSENRISGPTRG